MSCRRRILTLASVLLATVVASPAQARDFPAGRALVGRDFSAREAVLSLERHAQTLRGTPARIAPTLLAAQTAAVEYWGGQPCEGSVRVAYAPADAMPTANTGGVAVPDLWAVTSFNTPAGWLNYSEPPSTYTDCLITINVDVWTPVGQASNFPAFCALIVHEYGHMFGHPDLATDPPTSITYPIISELNERVPACVARYDGISAQMSR